MTVPEGCVGHMPVLTSEYIKTLSSVVSQVPSESTIVRESDGVVV